MPESNADRPNIVLIVTDQWRGDCLGLQGHPAVETPNLDHLFGRGTIADAPVELRDVMPTLLDAAGVEIPNGIEGRSVLPLCRGEQTEWRDALHGEHSRGETSNHWMTDGKEMYIWHSQTGEEQLFDLRTDLSNTRNLAATRSERVAYWRTRLIASLTGREEGYVDDGKLVVGRKPLAVLDSAGQG